MSVKLPKKVDDTVDAREATIYEASTNNGQIRAQNTKIDAIDARDATLPAFYCLWLEVRGKGLSD